MLISTLYCWTLLPLPPSSNGVCKFFLPRANIFKNLKTCELVCYIQLLTVPDLFSYIVDTSREAGDRLEKDKRLNRIFSKAKFDENTKFVSFAKIAGEIYSDGINWIKIIMLFYLAYKLAIKTIGNYKLTLKTLKFVARYIFTELLQWINSTGGGWVWNLIF